MSANTPHTTGAYAAASSWQRPLYSASAVCVGWYALILASLHAHPGAGVRDAALALHLLSLALGFGAVLAVDAMGLAVLLGWARVERLLAFSARADRLIWGGFVGLAVSGVWLRPDFSSGWTAVNFVAVLVAALNGVFAHALRTGVPPQLRTRPWHDLPPSLLWRGCAAALVSQAAWWTSILVGSLTS
ncbi:hypothetical protein [Kitasatospora mediocidica]|uniref:hypothetical protein n=1 Tax=Kitasatospora mediocidica TaxID=58352 RepID=UPI0012FBF77D|nr:hypothetical protein [Kitasatospora mediocidica]